MTPGSVALCNTQWGKEVALFYSFQDQTAKKWNLSRIFHLLDTPKIATNIAEYRIKINKEQYLIVNESFWLQSFNVNWLNWLQKSYMLKMSLIQLQNYESHSEQGIADAN